MFNYHNVFYRGAGGGGGGLTTLWVGVLGRGQNWTPNDLTELENGGGGGANNGSKSNNPTK